MQIKFNFKPKRKLGVDLSHHFEQFPVGVETALVVFWRPFMADLLLRTFANVTAP